MRLLVTGNETDNAFAVVGTGGTNDKPIGFHYHKEAHDVFLCLKGTSNVWANDEARSLGPGDFASVPPVSKYCESSWVLYLWLGVRGGSLRINASSKFRIIIDIQTNINMKFGQHIITGTGHNMRIMQKLTSSFLHSREQSINTKSLLHTPSLWV